MAGIPSCSLGLSLHRMVEEVADCTVRAAQNMTRLVGRRSPKIMGEAYELGWQDCAEQIERDLATLLHQPGRVSSERRL